MESKQEICLYCRWLDRYYTRELKHFQATAYGRCRKNMLSVEIHESCDGFQKKPVQKRCSFLLEVSLSQLLTELSELRKILETQEREKNESDKEM